MLTPSKKKLISERIEELAEQIRRGSFNNNVDKKIYDLLLEEFEEALTNGLGPKLTKGPLYNSLLKNVKEFLACKNYQLIENMKNSLNDADTIESFKEKCLAVSDLMVNTHGDIESDFVYSNADSAKIWTEQTKLKDTHLMVYHAMMDDVCREDHSDKDNIALPVNSPFWNTYYPPWDYNCRCFTTMERAEEVDETPERAGVFLPEDGRKGVDANPGKSGQIYSQDHSYFTNTPDSVKTDIYGKLL